MQKELEKLNNNSVKTNASSNVLRKRLTLNERIVMTSSKKLSTLIEWDSLMPKGKEL